MSTTTQTNTTQTKTQLFSVAISREEATRLEAQIAGEVLLPEDEGYAAECSSYTCPLVAGIREIRPNARTPTSRLKQFAGYRR